MIEQQLIAAHEFITARALYTESISEQLATELTNAARALEAGKPTAARAWLRNFRLDFASSKSFAVLYAHDKRKVGERWDSVRSLADWAWEQLHTMHHLYEAEKDEA